jgi:hypothetical protein
MKLKFAFASVASIAFAHTGLALEHITLTGNTPSKSVVAGALVEIIGTNKNNDGNVEYLKLTFADGAVTKMVLRGKESSQYTDMRGNVFTGLTSVTLELANGTPAPNTSVTLKITPSNEIGVSPPGAVLVLPQNSTGNYDVIIESSGDLVNWTTLTTHSVNAETSPNFFRARIIKTSP